MSKEDHTQLMGLHNDNKHCGHIKVTKHTVHMDTCKDVQTQTRSPILRILDLLEQFVSIIFNCSPTFWNVFVFYVFMVLWSFFKKKSLYGHKLSRSEKTRESYFTRWHFLLNCCKCDLPCQELISGPDVKQVANSRPFWELYSYK